jgi:hypothetical protein
MFAINVAYIATAFVSHKIFFNYILDQRYIARNYEWIKYNAVCKLHKSSAVASVKKIF